MFTYQRGLLFRFRAMGECDGMETTVLGFYKWMWRGLAFILPFLLASYLWELYNAYTLFFLFISSDVEWHVPTLSVLFTVLFLGNSLTTIMESKDTLLQYLASW